MKILCETMEPAYVPTKSVGMSRVKVLLVAELRDCLWEGLERMFPWTGRKPRALEKGEDP